MGHIFQSQLLLQVFFLFLVVSVEITNSEQINRDKVSHEKDQSKAKKVEGAIQPQTLTQLNQSTKTGKMENWQKVYLFSLAALAYLSRPFLTWPWNIEKDLIGDPIGTFVGTVVDLVKGESDISNFLPWILGSDGPIQSIIYIIVYTIPLTLAIFGLIEVFTQAGKLAGEPPKLPFHHHT
eukprot:c12027_g1_i1.p1 GENE.c12027_g1_i1~~c12027_g1_i1.p1  ORF type:complete len:191 (-),score=71.08 c12027_g1_i1:27-566(-)